MNRRKVWAGLVAFGAMLAYAALKPPIGFHTEMLAVFGVGYTVLFWLWPDDQKALADLEAARQEIERRDEIQRKFDALAAIAERDDWNGGHARWILGALNDEIEAKAKAAKEAEEST